MRKLILAVTLTVLSAVWEGTGMACFSQNSNLNKAISYYEDYERFNVLKSFAEAKIRIDSAAKNPATMDKHKTWFYRGKIYLARFDMSLKEQMNKSAETDINKKIISAYNSISMSDVDEALSSFQRSLELDEKKTYEAETNAKIRVIASNYSDKGYATLKNDNYKDAITYYDKYYEMKLKMGVTDTAALYNLSIASLKLKDYKKAEKYLTKLIDLKYRTERCYLSLIQTYHESGDTASAKKTVRKGVAELPESYMLLVEQINLDLKEGNSESAISSINRALSKNPDNHELHLVLGQTYNKMAFPKDATGKDLVRPANSAELAKKAEEEFQKTIGLKSDYFSGFYSLGIFYNNVGADVLRQAESFKDPKKVKAEESRADEYFKKAIPLLEKANDLKPGDRETMYTLRQLYARTGQGDSEKYKNLSEAIKKQ